MKSTVPAGTGASIKRVLAEKGKEGLSLRVLPGVPQGGLGGQGLPRTPTASSIGDDGDWAGDAVVDLYAPLDAPLVRTDIASAEMVKLASNAFLATKISFINEIANVCEETGADVIEVARGMGLDDRIGQKFLQAGIGFGGSCLTGDETRPRPATRTYDADELRAPVEPAARPRGTTWTTASWSRDSLEVLSWIPGGAEPQFMPVMCLTRRDYEGDIVEVRTKMGRRIRCTPDHPVDRARRHQGRSEPDTGAGRSPQSRTTGCRWPRGATEPTEPAALAPMLGAVEAAEVHPSKVIVRLGAERAAALAARPMAERREIFAGNVAARSGEVKRTGTVPSSTRPHSRIRPTWHELWHRKERKLSPRQDRAQLRVLARRRPVSGGGQHDTERQTGHDRLVVSQDEGAAPGR